jgi:hypothetical protein
MCMNDEKLVSISDMYLAAALTSFGHCYDHIDRSEKRLKFMFPDKQTKVYLLREGTIAVLEYLYLEQVQAAYTSGQLMFLPDYPDKIKRIKSAIHNAKE